MSFMPSLRQDDISLAKERVGISQRQVLAIVPAAERERRHDAAEEGLGRGWSSAILSRSGESGRRERRGHGEESESECTKHDGSSYLVLP